MGMPAWCTQLCACPLKRSAQTPLCSALCFMDYSKSLNMVPIKYFYRVNVAKLTLLSFPKDVSKRQKLIAFLFLVDLFHMDFLTSST